MRTVSIINAFYKNRGMLQRQFEHFKEFPADLRENLQYVVCDDASPEGLEAEAPAESPGIDFQIYRITRKTPWNWMSARNIGASHATGAWLLFTDMDHMVPLETASYVTRKRLDERNVYRFARVDAPDLTPYHPHPNSWLMSRAMFDRFVGFDERWAGCYGSDYDVRDRLKRLANEVVVLNRPLVRVPREIVPDASTTDLGRKQSEFSAAVPEKRRRIQTEGGPPLTLSYPYQRVA